jgi:peptidoglycan LD-endopeptidase CwlK
MFVLSKKSWDILNTAKPELVAVVSKAIQITKVDFGVIEGLRTVEKQREYYEAGASKTMNSKHITGDAVDLVAYIGSRPSWELNLYDDIADAIRQVAIDFNVSIRWGGAWNVPDIRMWQGNMEHAMNYYVDTCRREARRPFIDAPHFELS